MTPVQLPLELNLPTGMRFANFEPGENAAVVDALRELSLGRDSLAYCFGPGGTGKTHLASAAAAMAQALGAVAYLPMRDHQTLDVSMLEGLQRCHLVVVDDADAVAGVPAFEEALNHLHNRVREAGRSLLYTGSTPPLATDVVLADLRSRLGAGAVWQLTRPDDDVLRAALARRARERGMVLPDSTVGYVVSRLPRDMRVLMRCLSELERRTLIERKRPVGPLLREVVEALKVPI